MTERKARFHRYFIISGEQVNKSAVRRNFALLPSAVAGEEHLESSGLCLAAPPLAHFSVLLLGRCGSCVPCWWLSWYVEMLFLNSKLESGRVTSVFPIPRMGTTLRQTWY